MKTDTQSLDQCCKCGTPRSELKEIPWARGTDAIICKRCRQTEVDEKIAAFQDKLKEDDFALEYNSDPICPHCGTGQSVDDDSDFYEDGEYVKTCGYCDLDFKMTTDFSITYTTEKP
jgi:hypothetical protein